MRWVRSNAEKYGIKKDKIGILGFSAGGHLASTIGTHFETPTEYILDDLDKISSRPDFMVLVYPVISLTAEYTHKGSRRFLLGEYPDPELVEYLSNEKQITADTPPTFLTSTYDDSAVPVENSLSFLQGLRKAGVRGAIYISAKGRHGLGLGGGETGFEQWPTVCEAWFREMAIID
jgi:acetyl esterase/lipase